MTPSITEIFPQVARQEGGMELFEELVAAAQSGHDERFDRAKIELSLATGAVLGRLQEKPDFMFVTQLDAIMNTDRLRDPKAGQSVIEWLRKGLE